MNKRIILFVLCLLSVVVATARSTAEGKVFIDANGNGVYDKGERLLEGIAVSDGCRVVLTDSRGRYRIEIDEFSNLFPILPAAYTMSQARLVNSAFIDGSRIRPRGNDFALVAKPIRHHFRLNALGDVQVSNLQELDYASRTLFPELLDADSTDVNLFLGDLVNNNLALYPQLARMMNQLPSRTYTCLGNHDRNADSVRSRQVADYCRHFGADVYAFDEGDVHFIVLNNVYGKGARGYEGRISDRQLRFVEADLARVPSSKLVTVVMHIPLAVTLNRQALFTALGQRPVLAITAHLHRLMRAFYTNGSSVIHELGAGATCGFWWVGERDWEGVPMALQQGGTPRNYFVVDFDGPRYTFRCKGVGLDARKQMTIHIAGLDTLDRHLRDMADVPQGSALFTIWGGSDSTMVRCRVDHGQWQPCPKARLMDPNAARVREMNLSKAYPTSYNRRNPIRKQESPQLWAVQLTADQVAGSHVIEVEASDAYGFQTRGIRSYCGPGAE